MDAVGEDDVYIGWSSLADSLGQACADLARLILARCIELINA